MLLRKALLGAAAFVVAGATVVAGTQHASAATIDTSATYVFVNRHSGKAMDLYGWSTADGAAINQYTRNDLAVQQWKFVSAGSGYYQIKSAHSGKVLELPTSNDGQQLVQNTSSSTNTRQQFSVKDADSGYVRFINRASGKALDLWEWSTADGAKIAQFQDLNGANQQWQLNKLGTVAWSSSDQWGTWSSDGYTLYNNIWGSGAGPQTIWANSASNWGVWANHPNTGGIKSYPNATRAVNRQLSALSSVTSSFNVTVPNAGAYTSAYDIWADGNTYEIMLWMNKYGPVGPLGSFQANVTVGGHSWAVYKGTNGANEVFSFIRTSNTSSGTVDIKAVMTWIKNRGWFGNVTLSTVQFGYEITSAGGGLDFRTNSFSVSYA